VANGRCPNSVGDPAGKTIAGLRPFGPNLAHVVPGLRFIVETIDRTGQPPRKWRPIQANLSVIKAGRKAMEGGAL
jgi:hypothetical protein